MKKLFLALALVLFTVEAFAMGARPGLVRGGGFRPDTVPNLALWLRGDRGVTEVSSLVSNWADQSGNGNDASQGTADNRPDTTTVNGRPALLWDNSNDGLSVAADATIDNLFDGGGYIIFVARQDDTGSVSDRYLQKAPDTGVGGWSVDPAATPSGGTRNIAFKLDFDGAGIAQWDTTARPTTDGQTHIIEITYDSDSTDNDPVIRVDGAIAAITETVTPLGSRQTDTPSALIIGNRPSLDRTFNGAHAEILLFSSEPSDDEKRKLRVWMSQRWGVSIQ